MNLLIDIGNTRLKWGMAARDRIVSSSSLANTEISLQRLADVWSNCIPPRHVAIACVSSESIAGLVISAAHELWPDAGIVRITSQAQAFGVTNAYPMPEKLGVDRWLLLVAARHFYPLPACIVDCGTAITIDLLDEKGRHRGGMICPGLMLMKQSLAQGTEALRYAERGEYIGLANDTEAAIAAGVLTAAIGLIEHVFSEQQHATALIMTGGDADAVAEHLVYEPVVDPDLVLRGLTVILAGSGI
ncbi:MAG: type III pantothenate kinase [Gammaproteobacteria bacterium]